MAINAFDKLKKSRLGAPPTDENPQIADQPAVATVAPAGADSAFVPQSSKSPSQADTRHRKDRRTAPVSGTAVSDRIDGRTLRRTGRSVQFATKVTPEFDTRIRRLAQREGRLIIEILEAALDAYEREAR